MADGCQGRSGTFFFGQIKYHAVREAVVMGEALVAHIGTAYNLADLFTKALYGQTRRFLVGRIMYDVFPYMDKAPTDKT